MSTTAPRSTTASLRGPGHALTFAPPSASVAPTPDSRGSASAGAGGLWPTGSARGAAPAPRAGAMMGGVTLAVQPLQPRTDTRSSSAGAAAGSGSAAASGLLPRPPPGTHAIAPQAHYPPSFPSAGVYAVAQAMPQPPPRASAAAGAQQQQQPHSASARSSKQQRKIVTIAGGGRSASPAHAQPSPPLTPSSARGSTHTPAGSSSSAQQPFVFRSVGKQGCADAWLSEEQKEGIAQEVAVQQAQEQERLAAEQAALAYTAQRQRALLAQSSLYLSPSQASLANQMSFAHTTAPVPLSFHPARPPTATAVAAAIQSVQPASFTFAPAAQPPPSEGVFVIRPGSRTAAGGGSAGSNTLAPSSSSAVITRHHASASSNNLPPIGGGGGGGASGSLHAPPHHAHTSSAPHSFLGASTASSTTTTHNRNHSLRSAQPHHAASHMLTNLFPHPPPSQGGGGATRLRPTNHFTVLDEEEYHFAPAAAAAAAGAAAGATAAGGKKEAAEGDATTAGNASAAAAAAESSALAEATRALDAERAEREEASAKLRAESAARSQADDAAFAAEWSAREAQALPLLVQYLSSPAGRSLLLSKPAHGFIVDDVHAFLELEIKGHTSANPAWASATEWAPLGATQQQHSRKTATSFPAATANGTVAATAAAGSSSAAQQQHQQVKSDLLLLLHAVCGSAVVALWLLEKIRLRNCPIPDRSAASASGSGGGIGGSSSGARSLPPPPAFSKASPPPVRFAHVADMASGLARARERMQRQQREWLAFLTDAGLEANPARHAAIAAMQHQAHAALMPPALPLFPSELTRARLAMHPHMDALWVTGAGHAAEALLKDLAFPAPSSCTAAQGEVIALEDTSACQPQFESFAHLLRRVAAGVAEAKANLRATLREVTRAELPSVPDAPAAAAAPAASSTSPTAAAAAAAAAAASSHPPPSILDESLLSFLCDPSTEGQLPQGEYVYSESLEPKAVGLKSNVKVKASSSSSASASAPSPQPSAQAQLQLPSSMMLGDGIGDHASASAQPSPAASAAPSAAPSAAHSRTASISAPAAAVVPSATDGGDGVAVDIPAAPDAATEADARASASATSSSAVSAGPSPAPRSRALLLTAASHPLPPIPEAARVVAHIDGLALALHFARGLDRAQSFLRAMGHTYATHGGVASTGASFGSGSGSTNAPLTRLSHLLSLLHAAAHEAQTHLEDLAHWFEGHGADLLRNLQPSSSSNNQAQEREAQQHAAAALAVHTDGAAQPSSSAAIVPASSTSSRSPLLLDFSSLSTLYLTVGAGARTLSYIQGLAATKKKFSDAVALTRRLCKIHALNLQNYVSQRAIVRQFLESPAASLYLEPSSSRSPVTFDMNCSTHVDQMLDACMIPDSSSSTAAASASLDAELADFGSGAGSATHGGAPIPLHWHRSAYTHASGALVVKHLEFILRQRRCHSIQEYRVKLSMASGSEMPRDENGEPLSKVVQPLLFHDADSLVKYMVSLSARAKVAVEATYSFVSSTSSALLLRKDDPTYCDPTLFHNPDGLADFAPSKKLAEGPNGSSSGWFIDDALALFESGATGHGIAEYIQRLSDAKLVHLHARLDEAVAAQTEAEAAGRIRPPSALPMHPLAVPCTGDPLLGLKGCSFHFPTREALSRLLDTLHAYDEAQEIAKMQSLAEQVHAATDTSTQKARTESPREMLLAWLQREENTVLSPAPAAIGSGNRRSGSLDSATTGAAAGAAAPSSRAALIASLTLEDCDRLMADSGAGPEHTLPLLQGLQKAGKTYPTLEVLIGAVAYALHPEDDAQPKEGVRVSHAEIMQLLHVLCRVESGPGPVNQPALFSAKMAVISSAAASSSSVDSRSSASAPLRSEVDALNPLGLDAAGLLASGDPIAPQMYGVSLGEIQSIVGYAFGVSNLLGILQELQEAGEPAPTTTASTSTSTSARGTMHHGQLASWAAAAATSGSAAPALSETAAAASAPSQLRKWHSFSDLKSSIVAHIKALNPYRSWMGLPALCVFSNPTFSPSAPAEVQMQEGPSFDNKACKDVYDFLWNTSHSSAALHPSSSSSSSSRGYCRLLEHKQQHVPVQKGDAVILLRYEFCEQLRRICDDASELHLADAQRSYSSKQTLFILKSMNDPTPSFKSYPNLPALVDAVRVARARTDPELVKGVEALGAGAREIFSYLNSASIGGGGGGGGGGGMAAASAAEADLPGYAESTAARLAAAAAASGSPVPPPREKLVITNELLASLVEAGGSVAGEGEAGDGDVGAEDQAASAAPPPALTILAHLSLLGEEYSKGQGAELIAAVKESKSRAEALRRALADNIKASVSGDAGASSSSKQLLKSPPPKVAESLAALHAAIEDLVPKLAEVRPMLTTSLPNALRNMDAKVSTLVPPSASAAAAAAMDAAVDAQSSKLADLKSLLASYESDSAALVSAGAAAGSSIPASAGSLCSSLSSFVSSLQSLFIPIPSLSKNFNAFFLCLQPLHQSVHTTYSHLYPSVFYLSHHIAPTPQPFFEDILPQMEEAIGALTQLRADCSCILNVQRSLTFVLEKLSRLFVEAHAILEQAAKIVGANRNALQVANRAAAAAAASSNATTTTPSTSQPALDPLFALLPSVSSTDVYLLSLLPFLSSLFETNEHHLTFLQDLIPFFETQLRPLLPKILPLLIPVKATATTTAAAAVAATSAPSVAPADPAPASAPSSAELV